MIRIFAIRIALLSAAVVALSGCFSSNPKDIAAFKMPNEVDVTMENYILQPPDVILVQCEEVPEIDGQEQMIRPDGIISFENIGELEAAGKRPSELKTDIYQKLTELYRSSAVTEDSVDVRVVSTESKMYYVLGQVFDPGPKLYTGRDTVLTAVAAATLNPMAWKERIQVIRPSSEKGGDPDIFEINFDRLEAHGNATKNVLLEEGDIIYVPPTVLGWIGLKLEEIITPIARAFTGAYIIRNNGSTVGGGRGF